MGKTFLTQNRFLSLVWWSKVLIAILISAGGLSYGAYLVHSKYVAGVAFKKEETIAKAQESKPIVINSTSPACSASTLGRVEPPDGKIFFGFHINWQETTPRELGREVGRHSAIMYVTH